MKNNAHLASRHIDKISFYVVAHADDWQLFMCPQVYDDIVAPGCKVVFIITTAGDAGMDRNFWAAREEGAKSSVRFCLAPISPVSESCGTRIFNDHLLHYCLINNTTTYFFRLPDGNLDGNGHESAYFQSLSKLRSAQIDTITAVDHSATYQTWQDFVATLESIICFEIGDGANNWIHYLNPDININPNDHPDHMATGAALQQMGALSKLYQLLFLGYSSCNNGEQLSPPDFFRKTGMFAAYEKAVYDACGYSTLAENAELYGRWCCSKANVIELPMSK